MIFREKNICSNGPNVSNLTEIIIFREKKFSYFSIYILYVELYNQFYKTCSKKKFLN